MKRHPAAQKLLFGFLTHLDPDHDRFFSTALIVGTFVPLDPRLNRWQVSGKLASQVSIGGTDVAHLWRVGPTAALPFDPGRWNATVLRYANSCYQAESLCCQAGLGPYGGQLL